MTEQALEDLLVADGWPMERLDATTWRSGFRGENAPSFRFFVRVIPSWVCLTIVPFVVAPAGDAARLAFFGRLLELNREITLAKLALDRRDVLLTVELSREHLAPSQIKDGLDALVYYANAHHAELTRLAQEPDTSS